MNKIIRGDSLEKLKELEENSIDTLITDPPYGLSFMGKKWDYDVPGIELWKECLRVLKPGGTALIFAGSRTQHRMACNVEDAGFELFDTILWLYGQGFPKSHNIEKALLKKCTCGNMEVYDKQNTKHNLRPMQETNLSQTINLEDKQGEVLQSELSEQSPYKTVQGEESKESRLRKEERLLEGGNNTKKTKGKLQGSDISEVSEEVSTDGKKRRLHNATQTCNGSTHEQTTNKNGSGTSQRPQSEQQLNPEPCSICKQFLAQEVRSWKGFGTALKPSYEPIICARKKVDGNYANNALKWGVSGLNIDGGRVGTEEIQGGRSGRKTGSTFNASIGDKQEPHTGRFPANIILDEEAGKMLDEQSGERKGFSGGGGPTRFANATGGEKLDSYQYFNDKGGASRFFYCAKSSKSERNAGCEGLEEKKPCYESHRANYENTKGIETPYAGTGRGGKDLKNNHPTVKPLKLMEYLCTLTKTPTGGVVLDPFAGSGTTGVACINTDRDYILIEREEEYIEIIKARIEHTTKERSSKLF